MRFSFGQQLLTSVNTNRMRSLLAYLVLHGEEAQSREQLAFLLWPESEEAQARTNLRQLLHNLRRALPVDCSLLVADNHTVRWKPDSSCSIDVVEFEAAVRAAGSAPSGDVTAIRKALEEAARLYQDDLLPDLYDDWLATRREELRQQLAIVLNRLAELIENTGDYQAGIRHAARLVALDPLRESYYQILMRLHLRNHDRSSALRVYHQCMRNLQRELGVSPGKTTQDLFMQALKSEELPSALVELPPFTATKPLRLVGRRLEWERLLDCWRMATQGGAQCALIVGEPGIGKSRLAEELYEFCAQNSDQAVAKARCYFAQGRLAYGPVTELLRSEPLRLARSQLAMPQLVELARVLPEILVEYSEIPPPQPLMESWQRLHFYEALNAVFRKVSRPFLVLIDDLQWCDSDSFEWLHSLFRSGAADGILLLGTVRVDEAGRDHPLTELTRVLRQSNRLLELPIAPLSAEETTALASQIATRTCDAAFMTRLYQATKGNPLFVVESVRASLEDHQSGNAVPPRVQAVIAARFAQLSPPAYELAGLAATIGRPFSFDLLAKATDWDEDSLSRALEELWQRRIIDGRETSSYDYAHDLLREVANAELSPIRKRTLHRRVARALEELNANDLSGVSGRLAAHYEAAGLPEQAIRYYRLAASVARQRFADSESADLIRRALSLCRNFPESTRRDQEELELLVTLGPSLVTTHGYTMPEVGATYERGLALAKQCSDRKHLFTLTGGAWLFHIVRGELEESRRLAQACVDCGHEDGIQAEQMAGHFLLGTSLYHLGQLSASWDQIDLAMKFSNAPTHNALALFAGPDVSIFCQTYGAHLMCQFGNVENALAMCDQSIARAREISHPFTLGITLDYAAMLNVYRCDPQLTLVRGEEAFEICRKHGFAYYLALAEIFVGWATGMGGDVARGLAQLRHGIEALKATGAELRLPFYYGLLAEVCGLAGQLGEALANIATGFAFLRKNGELWPGPELHRIHGDLLLNSGDVFQAEASYRRAVDSARQSGSLLFELRAASRLRGVQDAGVKLAER